MEKLPIYNIVLGEADGIQKMSLVDWPAVDVDFLAFEKQTQVMSFSVDEDQHVVYGPALRADFPIYRNTKDMGEFYVVFSKDTVKQLYEKFMMNGLQNKVNLMHTTDTDGCFLILSFLKDKEHGIDPVGFEEVEDGSWFVSYKICNDNLWKAVKEGQFRGFSVEGIFELQIQKPKLSSIEELEALIDELTK